MPEDLKMPGCHNTLMSVTSASNYRQIKGIIAPQCADLNSNTTKLDSCLKNSDVVRYMNCSDEILTNTEMISQNIIQKRADWTNY